MWPAGPAGGGGDGAAGAAGGVVRRAGDERRVAAERAAVELLALAVEGGGDVRGPAAEQHGPAVGREDAAGGGAVGRVGLAPGVVDERGRRAVAQVEVVAGEIQD